MRLVQIRALDGGRSVVLVGDDAHGRTIPGGGITAEALSLKIDDFLGSRGFREDSTAGNRATPPHREIASGSSAGQTALDFVCEEDVRRAIEGGTKLVLSDRAIVTPSARDLGEQYRIFTIEG